MLALKHIEIGKSLLFSRQKADIHKNNIPASINSQQEQGISKQQLLLSF